MDEQQLDMPIQIANPLTHKEWQYLQVRGMRIGLKQKIPAFMIEYEKPHTYPGFMKRMSNWHRALLQLENPNGIKKQIEEEDLEVIEGESNIRLVKDSRINQ